MSHSDTGDSSKGNYSIHELNAVEILELLERAGRCSQDGLCLCGGVFGVVCGK